MMWEKITNTKFGPSGNSESFYEQGFTSSEQMPAWLSLMGLEAYEYQCSKGVNIGMEKAVKIGEAAAAAGISLSIHAPYYISIASEDPQKRINSSGYIMKTLEAARWMGASRIVVHAGSAGKMDRREALEIAADTLKKTIAMADEAGFGDIVICPEVLGKQNQLGSIEEIIYICSMDERLIPTIDFGHLHARTLGAIRSTEDFLNVFDQLTDALGYERIRKLHCHFSRIEFTKGGEKRHWTYLDTQFGPDFYDVASAIVKRKLEPVIICESQGRMAEDAVLLKKIYYERLAIENAC